MASVLVGGFAPAAGRVWSIHASALSVLTALMLGLVAWARIARGVATAPDADALYPAALASDLLAGRPIEWWVPPATGFFPELPLALLAGLLRLGVLGSVALSSAAFCVLLYAALRLMLVEAGVSGRAAAGASFAVIAIGILGPATADALSLQLAWPGFHQGILPLVVLALGLGLRQLRAPSAGAAMLLALTIGLAVAVDRLALAQASLPLAFWALLPGPGGARRRTILAPVTIGSALGLAVASLISLIPGIEVGPVLHQDLESSAGAFLAMMIDAGPVAGWPRYLVAVSAVAAIAFLGCPGRGAQRFTAAHQLIILVALATFLAPLVAALWAEPKSVRYQMPFYLLPPTWLLALVLDREVARTGRRGLAFAGAMAAAVLAGSYSAFGPGDGVPFAAERSLARALEGSDYRVVLAEYWDAKPLARAGGFAGRVCQITRTGLVYPWIVNLDDCLEAWRDLDADQMEVAVLGRRLDPQAVGRRFGAPIRVETAGPMRLAIYPAAALRAVIGRDLCAILSPTVPGAATAPCHDAIAAAAAIPPQSEVQPK